MRFFDWLRWGSHELERREREACVDRVLAHMHQVPKGWVIDGEWKGRDHGNPSCRCYEAVVVGLGRLIDDWPKPRRVETVYVCSACGHGADRANKMFNERIQAAFAERLGVTPPAPASPPSIGPFQQAIMAEQAQLAADFRKAERAQGARDLLANPTILSDYMEGAILGTKGGGDQ